MLSFLFRLTAGGRSTNVDQPDELLRRNAGRVLDAREESEFCQGRAPGAIYIPKG